MLVVRAAVIVRHRPRPATEASLSASPRHHTYIVQLGVRRSLSWTTCCLQQRSAWCTLDPGDRGRCRRARHLLLLRSAGAAGQPGRRHAVLGTSSRLFRVVGLILAPTRSRRSSPPPPDLGLGSASRGRPRRPAPPQQAVLGAGMPPAGRQWRCCSPWRWPFRRTSRGRAPGRCCPPCRRPPPGRWQHYSGHSGAVPAMVWFSALSYSIYLAHGRSSSSVMEAQTGPACHPAGRLLVGVDQPAWLSRFVESPSTRSLASPWRPRASASDHSTISAVESSRRWPWSVRSPFVTTPPGAGGTPVGPRRQHLRRRPATSAVRPGAGPVAHRAGPHRGGALGRCRVGIDVSTRRWLSGSHGARPCFSPSADSLQGVPADTASRRPRPCRWRIVTWGSRRAPSPPSATRAGTALEVRRADARRCRLREGPPKVVVPRESASGSVGGRNRGPRGARRGVHRALARAHDGGVPASSSSVTARPLPTTSTLRGWPTPRASIPFASWSALDTGSASRPAGRRGRGVPGWPCSTSPRGSVRGGSARRSSDTSRSTGPVTTSPRRMPRRSPRSSARAVDDALAR